MCTHTTPHLDRKVLLALVPLASLAASHEGNPNAHGPANFSEIAQSRVASAEAISSSSSSSSSSHSSHSTHLTPSLLHGIIPSVTTTTTTITTSPTSDPGAADQTRTQTVWATVVEQTQVVTVVKTLTPNHQSTATSTQSWPKGYCTGKGEVAVNGKCVPSTMVTSTIPTRGTTSPRPGETFSSSLSFTISSTGSLTTTPITTSTTSEPTSTSSTSPDTDPLVIIPVTGTATDLINYDTYTVPASLPPLLPLLLLPPPPPGPRPSRESSPSTSDDDPLVIIPVTGTVTDLADYVTVMVPSATATTVVVIPVSSSNTKSQDMGHMLRPVKNMGQGSRVLVHPTVSVGDRLTVVSGSDGSTIVTRASPMVSASPVTKGEDSGAGGEFCKERKWR